MKALIMANVGKGHFLNNEILPSCYLPVHNNMNVLERQISLLNVNGFANRDICVLLGSNGIWDVEAVRRRTAAITTPKIFTDKNNLLARNMFRTDFFNDPEGLLIIEGNQVFDIAILSRLRRYRHRDVLVVEQLIEPDETDHVIELDGNRVVGIENAELMSFPWISFAGIVRLSPTTLRRLREVVVTPIPLLDALGEIINDIDMVAIGYDDLLYGNLNGGHSDELVGGSYAKLNYRLIVKKKGSSEGRAKLINEITWLLNLPKELKPYFSEVLEYDIESPEVYFDVPYYGSRNLREHIFDGHFDADAATKFLENLLDWMFENVYSRKVSDAPDDWAKQKHVRRVLDRLDECSDKSEVLRRLIAADKILINGVEYKNIREIFTAINRNEEFLRAVNPAELVMIHGDLHFQNILVYNGNDRGFMLVDPRGELAGSDLYYDMGKLWHCFHGHYDAVHTDQFRLQLAWDGEMPRADYELTNQHFINVCDELMTKVPALIQKYDPIRRDPRWQLKTLFAETSHFASVATFHIDKTDNHDRATVLYLIGVRLANEFYDRFIVNDAWKA